VCQTCQDSAGILVLERTRSEPSNAACRIHSPRPRRSHDERISSSLVIKYTFRIIMRFHSTTRIIADEEVKKSLAIIDKITSDVFNADFPPLDWADM